jgi:hypothetical protein
MQKLIFFDKKDVKKAASSRNNLSKILVQKGFHIKKKKEKNVDLHGPIYIHIYIV